MATAIQVRGEYDPERNLVLTPVMNVEVAKKRLAEFQEFVSGYLVKDEDYGTIPGTPKPTLYKPGADKLCELYGLGDEYEIVSQIENFNAEPALFDYTIRCRLLSRRDGSLVASGMGSCNSYEGKYKFRDGQRMCPKCSRPAIIKGKEEYGGGWLCYQKKGGCGAKFANGDKSIEDQQTGKVLNDDIATLKNTILKMAKKRAKVDATLGATRSSGIFTQDIEDIAQNSDSRVQEAPSATQGKGSGTYPGNGAAGSSTGQPSQKSHAAPHSIQVEAKTTIPKGKSKGGNPYLLIQQDGKKMYCFDNPEMIEHGGMVTDMFALIGKAADSGAVCEFMTVQKGQYLTVVGLKRIGTQEYEGTVPVIQRQEVLEPDNIEPPYQAEDEDLPF